MRPSRALVGLVLCALSAVTVGCKKGPERTCKVNGVCFVCPDEKAQAMCVRDPSGARCKFAEPSHCR